MLTDLPPKLFRDAELELTPEQRHTYQLAEDEGVLRLTEMGEAATIQHVFELILRLKQICNFDPATGESAKLERLAADLEEVATSGKKAIVFSQWVDTLTALGRRLRRFGPLEYHGQIPPNAARRRDPPIPRRSAAARAADELRRRRRRAESAVRRLCVPLRSLVEPGRRGPGDQSGPSHRRRRAGHGHRDS